MMKKNRKNMNEPTIAPGLDDQNELEQELLLKMKLKRANLHLYILLMMKAQ